MLTNLSGLSLDMSEGSGCGKCGDYKRVWEHVASLLPFWVLEASLGKSLRISGRVVLAVGIRVRRILFCGGRKHEG